MNNKNSLLWNWKIKNKYKWVNVKMITRSSNQMRIQQNWKKKLLLANPPKNQKEEENESRISENTPINAHRSLRKQTSTWLTMVWIKSEFNGM